MTITMTVKTQPLTTLRRLEILAALLCLASTAPAANRLWDGGGANNNWSTAANWDAAIAAGDDLVFPGGAGVDATSLVNTNDLAASTAFRSITLSGTNYTLNGNALALTNGISHAGGGTNTVALNVQLNAHQQFASTVASGLLTVASNVALNGWNLTNNGAGGIRLAGAISGNGNLIKQGTGTLTLAGATFNTYVGTTFVNAGTLLLGKSGAVAIPGALVIGDGVGGVNADVVRLQANGQIHDNAPITINSSGLLDTDGFTELAGAVSGTGNLQLDAGIYTVSFIGSDVTFDGTISGTGSLLRGGSGAWILNGANTFSGNSSINGKVLVNGTLPANMTTVHNTLGGTGTVGRVTVNATRTLAPGLSPGRLTTSNITFTAGAIFRVELNGTNAAAGYDQLKVKGSVTLDGATLEATLGFASAISNVFTIIDNDGTDAVTNIFNGLAEGATANVSGTPFRVSYLGGTGNDVTLTQLTATQRPRLDIQPAPPANVVLAWATNFTGYTLEANTNLNPGVWTDVSPAPSVSGTNNVVTNSATGPQKFFRLSNP